MASTERMPDRPQQPLGHLRARAASSRSGSTRRRSRLRRARRRARSSLPFSRMSSSTLFRTVNPWARAFHASIAFHCARSRLASSPMRHRHALRVIGDGAVRVARAPGTPRAISSSDASPSLSVVCIWRSPRISSSVTSVGRSCARAARDLAARLAQLGRDPVEAELGVDLLLGLARDAAGAAIQPVLVQLVLLGPGRSGAAPRCAPWSR